MTKDLTKITDLPVSIINQLMIDSFVFKKKHDQGQKIDNLLKGKVVALVFEKPSLRTKICFETATTLLGGIPIFISSGQILSSGNYMKGRESIPDIAKNLERFADLIVARVFDHETIQEIAASTKIPVINALCDKYHPTQALADMMTIMWHKKRTDDFKVAYIGDGNNVATSLMHICASLMVNFTIASPKGYEIPKSELLIAMKNLKNSSLDFVEEPEKAVCNADVVYTDTFVSMGQEDEYNERIKAFRGYQVNRQLMKKAKNDALFMHCLPAHRGEEVTDEVIDSKQSVVFDQAECKLHTAKALLKYFLA